MQIKWARSATRHRVARRRSRYVIEHCGLRFREPSPEGDDRLVYLGDDEDGVALEVMAIEGVVGEVLVIHAMELRSRYRLRYEEARKWRK